MAAAWVAASLALVRSPPAAVHAGRSRSARSSFCALAAHEDDARGGWQGERWEGDEVSRPLGCMERLLNGRRSWSGAMTTAHVSVALLRGPPPTEAELLHGLARVFRRHPLLRSCVRGKSNHHIPDAAPYPMHSDYIDRAFHYGAELYRPEPNTDLQRFEPSPLPPEEMARRALRVASVAERSGTALEEAWRGGFDAAMDESVFDEDGDGPLCRFTLYASSSSSAALLYQANHAISDELSFNLLLAELLEARDRAEIEPRPDLSPDLGRDRAEA